MHQFTLETTIHAPLPLVFTCFYEPEYLSEWFAPGDSVVSQVMSDFKEGGKYRIKMQTPSGEETTLEGEYIQILTNERLVYSWAQENSTESALMSTVTVMFEGLTSKDVEITLEQIGFTNQDSCRHHQQAWLSCFEKLAIFAQRYSNTHSR